jgi:GNAT superfamily N-acetyltransferase
VSIVVRPATAEEIREVRLGVLRPEAPRVPSAYDVEPATVHVGAFDGDLAVACVTVYPQGYDDEPAAWRMRGMAVDPAYQGRGLGREVLDLATSVADDAGAPLIWANARMSAMAFYQRVGWEPVGPVFDHGPRALPHRVIIRRLGA